MVTRTESLRAYRDVLLGRLDAELHAAIEGVPGGEWDGMDVVRRKPLEDVLALLRADEPEASPTVAEVRTPGKVYTETVCPRCGIATRLVVDLSPVLETTLDGSTIKAKAASKAVPHTCGQLPLEATDQDEEQMRLADLIGPTESVLVLRRDMPRPDDATIDRPAEERCGAEVTDQQEGHEEADVLVCERLIDHDTPENVTVLGEDARDHWAEGGYGWHFEERPVPSDRPTDADRAAFEAELDAETDPEEGGEE